MRLDNLTHLSDADQDDVTYYASFEFYPFTESARCSFFKGILNGDGPRHGQFCAVRTLRDRAGREQDWIHLINSCKKTRDLADQFNKMLGLPMVRCPVPLLTQLECVSIFSPLLRRFRKHEKRLKKEEWVCLQPLLLQPVETWDISSVHRPSTSAIHNNCRSQSPGEHVDLAQAFSHFTWHVTRSLLVCDLQGNSHGESLTLTNPTVHSLNREFGPKDRSVQGIDQFFLSHSCNGICSSWHFPLSDWKPSKEVNIFQPLAMTIPAAGSDISSLSLMHDISSHKRMPYTQLFTDLAINKQ